MPDDLDFPAPAQETADAGRIDEMEGELADFKDQMSRMDINGRAIKGELDAIRDDLFQINETIKNLLCIYEVVSKDYNPFVESGAQAPMEPVEDVLITGEEKIMADGGMPEAIDTTPTEPGAPEPMEITVSSFQHEMVEEDNVPGEAMANGTDGREPLSLIQVFELLENRMQMLYVQRIKGESWDPQEISDMERLFSEFMRLGRE